MPLCGIYILKSACLLCLTVDQTCQDPVAFAVPAALTGPILLSDHFHADFPLVFLSFFFCNSFGFLPITY